MSMENPFSNIPVPKAPKKEDVPEKEKEENIETGMTPEERLDGINEAITSIEESENMDDEDMAQLERLHEEKRGILSLMDKKEALGRYLQMRKKVVKFATEEDRERHRKQIEFMEAKIKQWDDELKKK